MILRLTFTLLVALIASTNAAERPNVIVIFTDDMGWADLGVQSVLKDVKTPHLDQLAKDGVRCARGYVTAPQCVPSRAGLLTGRYQTRFGLEMNPQNPLTLREKTLADRLKAAGYVTGMVGKWHLDIGRDSQVKPDAEQPRSAYEPRNRGFMEYWNGSLRSFQASHDLSGNPIPNAPQNIVDERFRIDVQTDAAVGFLKRRAQDQQPFFLYLAYFAPHVPLEKPATYMARFANVPDEIRRMGLAAISAVDDGVGRIREQLKFQKMDRNTLIFFIADNGAPTTRNAWDGSLNDPLVGEKGMLTDGGIRVPFVATWPGKLPAGKVYEHPVISLDVAATAVAVAGQPKDASLDGVNLLPFLTGENSAAPHEALFWRWRSQAAVLAWPWKLVLLGKNNRYLFDHRQADPEKTNLAAQHPDIVRELEAKLRAFAAEQQPPGLPQGVVDQDQYFFDMHVNPGRKPDATTPSGGKSKAKGKAKSAAKAAPTPAETSSASDGWTARNSTLNTRGSKLVVSAGSGKPFLTHSGLSIPGPVTARVVVRSENGGAGNWQWRVAGSRDFVPEDTISFTIPPGGWHTIETRLPVKKETPLIHVRLVLPASGQDVEIDTIELDGSGAKQKWEFSGK
jgi:uncharacterized sulfatase